VTLNPLGVTLAPLQSTILQNVFTFFIVVERSNRPLSIFLEGYFQCGDVMLDNTTS